MFKLVIHPDELNINITPFNIQGDVAGTRVAVFWLANTPIVDDMPATGKNPVVRFMRMAANQKVRSSSIHQTFQAGVGGFSNRYSLIFIGLQKHEQVASTFPSILEIITSWFSIPHWQRQLDLSHYLIGYLVKTYHGKGWLIRLCVQIQDIFRAPDKFSTYDGSISSNKYC